MWWKIYFWIIALVSGLGILAGIDLSKNNFSFADVLSIFFSIIVLIGLYSFTYKKRVFTQSFWKVIFVMIVVLVVDFIIASIFSIDFLAFLGQSHIDGSTTISRFVGFLIVLPAYYTIYQLAFKKNKLSKK